MWMDKVIGLLDVCSCRLLFSVPCASFSLVSHLLWPEMLRESADRLTGSLSAAAAHANNSQREAFLFLTRSSGWKRHGVGARNGGVESAQEAACDAEITRWKSLCFHIETSRWGCVFCSYECCVYLYVSIVAGRKQHAWLNSCHHTQAYIYIFIYARSRSGSKCSGTLADTFVRWLAHARTSRKFY